MFDYTNDTVSLIQVILAAIGAVFFIMLILGGIADIIRDAFFGGW